MGYLGFVTMCLEYECVSWIMGSRGTNPDQAILHLEHFPAVEAAPIPVTAILVVGSTATTKTFNKILPKASLSNFVQHES